MLFPRRGRIAVCAPFGMAVFYYSAEHSLMVTTFNNVRGTTSVTHCHCTLQLRKPSPHVVAVGHTYRGCLLYTSDAADE